MRYINSMFIFLVCAMAIHANLKEEIHFKEKPQNQTVLIGADVKLNCSLHPNPELPQQSQWRAHSKALLGVHESGILPGSQRYSYVREVPEELNLHIENVQLEDDGSYECQMYRSDAGISRASAFINVIAPPSRIQLEMANSTIRLPQSTIDVVEGTKFRITCAGIGAKPEAEIRWYVNGKQVLGAKQWSIVHENKTLTSFAKVDWNVYRNDHNKTFECVVLHRETSTEFRSKFSLNVISSEQSTTSITPNKETQLSMNDSSTNTSMVSNTVAEKDEIGNTTPASNHSSKDHPPTNGLNSSTPPEDHRMQAVIIVVVVLASVILVLICSLIYSVYQNLKAKKIASERLEIKNQYGYSSGNSFNIIGVPEHDVERGRQPVNFADHVDQEWQPDPPSLGRPSESEDDYRMESYSNGTMTPANSNHIGLSSAQNYENLKDF